MGAAAARIAEPRMAALCTVDLMFALLLDVIAGDMGERNESVARPAVFRVSVEDWLKERTIVQRGAVEGWVR